MTVTPLALYYMIDGLTYQCPDLGTLVASRLVCFAWLETFVCNYSVFTPIDSEGRRTISSRLCAAVRPHVHCNTPLLLRGATVLCCSDSDWADHTFLNLTVGLCCLQATAGAQRASVPIQRCVEPWYMHGVDAHTLLQWIHMQAGGWERRLSAHSSAWSTPFSPAWSSALPYLHLCLLQRVCVRVS